MENIGIIVSAILSFASLLVAIGAIWTFSSRVKRTFRESIEEVVNGALTKYDEKIDSKLELAMVRVQNGLSNDICKVSHQIETLQTAQNEKNIETDESIKLSKESLIEAYKRDIRLIYYKLRETGEITDYDKSYVDKVIPKYKALGGNSDIEAKYKEICDIYGLITKENFEKARTNKKSSKKEVEPVEHEEQ